MNASEESENSDSTRDRLAEALADIDEAFVAGKEISAEAKELVDPVLRSELKRGASFLWLLEQAWPRRSEETTLAESLPSIFNEESAVERVADRPIFDGESTRFGRFEIVRTLGRGGFGIVFLAWDPELRRQVALKVPQPEVLASPRSRRRFLREAHAAGGLDHPNIIPVHETGTVGSVYYIASGYCEGPTLAEWLDTHGNEPAPICDAAQLVLTLARAVQHAHDRGVLHRDLKPSNVLLQKSTADESVAPKDADPLSGYIPRLTDFSLARIIDDEGTRTLSGIPFGSPSYMAPEQAEGKPAEMGPATDVHGLGTLLYMLLVGRPPYHGQTQIEILRRVVADEPIAPRKLRREIPRSLEAITLHCLEKSPSSRYESARELADDLERFLAGEPVRARPPRIVDRVLRVFRRHRIPLSATALVVLLSMSLVASIAWNRKVLSTVEAVTRRQADESKRYEQTASRLAYVADMHAAARAIDEASIGLARPLLAKYEPVNGRQDQRDFAWYHLKDRLRARDLGALTGHRGEAYHVEFSPDNSTLASCGKDGTVRLWEAASGRPVRTIDAGQEEVNWVSFSPDGSRIATAGDDGSIKVWDARTGENRMVLKGHAGEASIVRFTPDGKSLVSAGRHDEVVKHWDLNSKALIGSFHASHGTLENLAISPRGDLIATVGNNAYVKIWDLAKCRMITQFYQVGISGLAGMAFSHDGTRLATGGGAKFRSEIYLWDLSTGRAIHVFYGHLRTIYSIAFSSDDRTIISTSEDERIRFWDAATGNSLGVILGDQGRIWSVDASPAGKMIATVGETGAIKLWDSRPPRVWQELDRGGEILFGEFSRSGDLQEIRTVGTSGVDMVYWKRESDSNQFRKNQEIKIRSNNINLGATSANGELTAVAGHDRSQFVEIWGPAQNTPIAIYRPTTGSIIQTLVLDRTGQWLAVNMANQRVSLWDLHSGRELTSPEGATIAARGITRDGEVIAHDFRSHQDVLWKPLSRGLSRAGTFEPLVNFWLEGHGVPAATSCTIRFWEGEIPRPAPGTFQKYQGPISGFDVTSDGRIFALGDTLGRVKLWDVETRQELLSWEGLGGAIVRIAFAPDGMSLAALVNVSIVENRLIVFTGIRHSSGVEPK